DGLLISYESVEAIEAPTESELVIRLSKPEAFLLADLANSSLRLPDNPEIGTGPYRQSGPNEQETSDRIRLVAFEEYYRGRPANDLIELRRYDEHRSAWAALLRGEIDALHETNPAAMDFMEQQKTVRTFPHVRPYYMNLL